MNTAKTAIVTGASHGIGQMTALKLAAAGYDLAICCLKRHDSALWLLQSRLPLTAATVLRCSAMLATVLK